MDQTDSTPGQLRSIRWILALLLIPLLYILSYGPLVWLVQSGVIVAGSPTWSALATIYSPFDWMYNNSDWFRDLLAPYLALWHAD